MLLETFASDAEASLVHSLPPSSRFDELKVAVWLWSDNPGVTVSVRLRLPNQKNPQTGQTVAMEVYGETHQGGGQWQRLSVELSDRVFAENLRRKRSELSRLVGTGTLNVEDAYIDQVSLHFPGQAITWGLAIDDLEVSQVVPPKPLTPPNVGSRLAASESPMSASCWTAAILPTVYSLSRRVHRDAEEVALQRRVGSRSQ